MAKSGAAQSMVGSAAMLRQRLWQDFGIVEVDPNDDQRSYVSGFEDEIDEWAALNKFALYREYQEAQEKKKDYKQRQQVLREELEKQ